MKSKFRIFHPAVLITAFLLMLFSGVATAADRYVRNGATGANNGTDWTNAYTTLPATLTRGDTYYIADGAYSSYTFDDAESGSTLITIKKATVAAHGTSTGWSNNYGDGQVVFNGSLVFTRGYYTVNGQTRNESDWFAGAAYGIQILHNITNVNQIDQQQIVMGNNGGPATSYITIQYVYVDAPLNKLSTTVTTRQYAIDTDTYGGPQNIGLVFSRMFVNGSNNVWFIRTTTGTIIEYSASNGVASNGANHGEIVNAFFSVYNTIIRHNNFRNAYIGSGGTALIAIAGGRTDPIKPQLDIYGNVFSNFQCGDAAIGFLGNTDNGGNCTNCHIYNNTFVDGVSGTGIQFPDGTDNVISNNLWINSGNPPSIAAGSGGIVSHNAFGTGGNGSGTNAQVSLPTSIFVNYAGGNYQLASATTAGSTLSSPYNVDLFGNTRAADGVWDRGAYEFKSGAAASPVITSALTKSGTVGVPFSYTITATNSPASYSATPLPAGLSINTATGVLSGTPTTAVTTNVTIGATNAAGTGTATLVITISSAGSATSIWTPTETPVTPSNPDGAVEVGVKFRSDVSGTIKGIRFYKGAGNTGTHIGNLWTSGGTNLASVSFTGETASGWQQANFATPVSITAGTIYIASYYAPNGSYSRDFNGLNTGKDNPPLHAVANSESSNGVYLYGTGGFPNQSFSGTNYWVDVVFQATPAPPAITSALTKSGTVGVPFSYSITATNSSTSYSATPLPAGLSINTATGIISGTPTTVATTNVTIGASNTAGTGTATLVITISADTQAPAVPASLASSNITSTSFTLSWIASTDNAGVTGYEVFKNGISIGTTATTSISVTGLSAGTSYSMTVRARDAVPNWSAQSAALNVNTTAGTVTAPTFINEYETAWNTAATPKTTASFAVLANDVLVAYGMTEDAGITETISGGSLTWTQRQVVNLPQYTWVSIWTATVNVNKTMSVTFTGGGGTSNFGGNVLVFRNSSGVGVSSKANVVSSAPTLNLSTTQANSAIVVANADWTALNGSSRTWRTNAGGFTEKSYANVSGAYTIYGGYHANAGPAGTYAVGLTAPGGQKYSVAAIEIKGMSGVARSAVSIKKLSNTELVIPSIVTIYPNPARSVLNINMTKVPGQNVVRVFDINGRQLISQRVAQKYMQLDVKKLTQGLYFIKLEDASGEIIYSSKFFKN